ncbi:MAG: outer membrane protein assembly factor BamA [Proteobacteria bacterium]|nr:outer membrane protein assembly factor BamA [Pseudomonadota bacterium]
MVNWLKNYLKIICILLLVVPYPVVAQQAADSFVIEDVRIEGLRRFSPGVIFNRMPVEIGDSFSADRASEIIQALYDTGYFREVQVLRDGNIIVVQVEENPTIAEVTVSGAGELSEEALASMLDSAGISEAKVFNQSLIEEAARVIENAYVERNFFHAKVEVVSSPLSRNRVAILFNVDEGGEAAIRSIRIIGNEEFTTWRLRRDMRLETRHFLNFFTDDYRYSDARLQADLGRIRTRYLENGYLRFEVEARQVEISPDKRHIDIVIRLNEGKQYTIDDISFELAAGAAALPFELEHFRQYVEQQPGDIYSGRSSSNAVKEIRKDMSDLGYANVVVEPRTEINDEAGSARIVYTIHPHQVVFVRYINIAGNEITADKIIRRELLQFESERYSQEKINRSRSRVRRLGYFNRVQIDTVPVEGSENQVDLLISVEEAYTGEIRFGAGFASGGGLSYNAGFSNTNIFGSGNDFSADFSKTEDAFNFDFELDENYYTQDGITRHIGLTYGETDAGDDTSAYSIDGYKVEYGFDFPFTDDGTYNLYLAYQQVDINSTANTVIYKEFVDQHGEQFDTLLLEAGLDYDTRDAVRVPTEGQHIDVRGDLALPVLELEYYYLDYEHDYYRTINQIPSEPVLHARLGAGYGDAYGDGVYPFYRRFYLGGTDTLRGFSNNSIGYTEDAAGDAIGGRSRLYASLELSAEAKFFEEQQIFLVPFIDAGAVGEDFGLGSFRSSWGLELRWVSPVGPLRFSYVEAFLSKPQDDVETFQFSISTF